jgi:hypothetical protein
VGLSFATRYEAAILAEAHHEFAICFADMAKQFGDLELQFKLLALR